MEVFIIITKCPIIGKYLGSYYKELNSININRRSSPFNPYSSNKIKIIKNVFSLTIISKFTPIDIPIIIPNNVESSHIYRGTISNLELLLRNTILSFAGGISNFVSNYSNLTCKINLTCDDQMINIYAQYKNGYLEEFDIKRTNLTFENSKSTFNYSFDNRSLLLNLTNPIKSVKDCYS